MRKRTPFKDFKFKVTGNIAVITKYIGKDTEVIIPIAYSKNNEFYVIVGIGHSAFADTPVTKVEIKPGGIRFINNYAFYNCKALSRLAIPKSVIHFAPKAFEGCFIRPEERMPKLSDLLAHDNIVVQCRDSPDEAIIETAYSVYAYLRAHWKGAKLIYSGTEEITAPQLLRKTTNHIPLVHVTPFEDMSEHRTFVIVGCKYADENVEKFGFKPKTIYEVIDGEINLTG